MRGCYIGNRLGLQVSVADMFAARQGCRTESENFNTKYALYRILFQ